MKKIIFIVMMALVPLLAFATPTSLTTVTTLNWSNPTTYTNGSTLSSSDIVNNHVYWKTPSGTYTNTNSISTNGAATSFSLSNLPALPDGDYLFAVTDSVANAESGYSNDLALTVKGGVFMLTVSLPSPVTGLTAQ